MTSERLFEKTNLVQNLTVTDFESRSGDFRMGYDGQ